MYYVRLAALFILFVVSLAATKKLDAHSALYETCADEWVDAAEFALSYGHEEHLLERVQTSDMETYDGRPCPALIKSHKDILIAKLNTK